MWAPQVAAMAGAALVSIPVEHQHIALAAVTGHELPRDLPCFRDPDYLVYGKSEAGGVLFGGYEHDPVARWLDGVPWDHGGQTVPADEARFAPLMQGAARRFPFLADAGVVKLVCHPDAMTPDGNPLVGELPGVPGFFVAAGLSLNGFGGAGGIGKAVAELVTAGESELDLQAYRPWRFGAVHRDPRLRRRDRARGLPLLLPPALSARQRRARPAATHERAARAHAGRGRGLRHQERLGARRLLRARAAVAAGRARSSAPSAGPRRRTPPSWPRSRRALRERVGHDRHDLVRQDRGRRARARRPCSSASATRTSTALPGSVVYTQFLDERGGIVADVTVTRLAEQRFRVVTGAAAIDSDLGWLRLHARAGDGAVELRDETDALCVIGMWGPHARDVLGAVTDDDVSAEAFPFGTRPQAQRRGTRRLGAAHHLRRRARI